MPFRFVLALLASMSLGAATAADYAQPLFDAHLHYNAEAQAAHPVPDVFARLAAQGVAAALVTSRPNAGTRRLAAATADGASLRVVPFLRPYRTDADRASWFKDPAIWALIEDEFARDIGYRGIGEFHVHGASDAAGPVVKRVVDLAVARGLWLHAHCDEAALEAIYAHDPRVKVIWAHTGFTTPVAQVQRYLERHPTLVGELSYRGGVTAAGRVTPEWRALFLQYPDRFLLGSDTWVNERWTSYGDIVSSYRSWLADLPPAVARQIAWDNAARMFDLPPGR
jgi:hypothetical protein